VCSGLLIWVAAIHLHLWSEGYRDIATVGPLFLADAVAGFVLAAVLLLWPRPLARLLGAGFMASTLGGLIVSLNFGLFGFREASGASFVTETIILESVGAVALLAWSVAVWHGWTRSRFSSREAAHRSGPPAVVGPERPTGASKSLPVKLSSWNCSVRPEAVERTDDIPDCDIPDILERQTGSNPRPSHRQGGRFVHRVPAIYGIRSSGSPHAS
jgi:hypothetical protein